MEEIEKELGCNTCLNKDSAFCEITISRIDGHAYCKYNLHVEKEMNNIPRLD